jgi:hypothetical protein
MEGRILVTGGIWNRLIVAFGIYVGRVRLDELVRHRFDDPNAIRHNDFTTSDH